MLEAEMTDAAASQRPIVVMPLHDPTGVLFPHLSRITPQLRALFAEAFIGVTAHTAAAQPEWLAWLKAQDFFRPLYQQPGLAVGDQFRELYVRAAAAYPPDQVLHLCFEDRLAFVLQGAHCQPFVADIQAVRPDQTPLIFHRSAAAWATHPHNYRVAEGMVTTAGELLFGQVLDFAWCHLALRASQLAAIMPGTRRPDISVVAEMVLQLRGARIHTRDVDWLAWEDPFIEGYAPAQLKQEREASAPETHKRLAYVLPMLQLLYAAADGKSG
jgi:hypothetical protein